MNTIETLAKASESLLMISESDYPLEPFEAQIQSNGELTEQQLLKHLNYSEKTKVEIVSVDDFFNQACAEHDWQSQEEQAATKKFQSLVAILKAHLNQLQVFRICKTDTNIEAYILGQTPDGKVAGLKTQLVET